MSDHDGAGTRLDNICDNSVSSTDRTVDMLVLAFTMTIVFIVLSLPSFDRLVGDGLPSYNWVIFIKAIVFFILAYLIDRLILACRGGRTLPEDS